MAFTRLSSWIYFFTYVAVVLLQSWKFCCVYICKICSSMNFTMITMLQSYQFVFKFPYFWIYSVFILLMKKNLNKICFWCVHCHWYWIVSSRVQNTNKSTTYLHVFTIVFPLHYSVYKIRGSLVFSISCVLTYLDKWAFSSLFGHWSTTLELTPSWISNTKFILIAFPVSLLRIFPIPWTV